MSGAPKVAYVRSDMLPESPPPPGTAGVIKWLRENLFAGWFNSLMTILAIYVVWSVLSGTLPWVFNGIWDAGSLNECREIRDARGLESAACWAVINERWLQMLFGFYPTDNPVLARLFYAEELAAAGGAEVVFGGGFNATQQVAFISAMKDDVSNAAIFFFGYWRPLAALALLVVAVAPILYSNLPRSLLIFSLIYPFIAFFLLWGGSVWLPALVALGLLATIMAGRYAAGFIGSLGGLIVSLVVFLAIFMNPLGAIGVDGLFPLLPQLRGALDAAMPWGLPYIPSDNFGGFMLAIIIGTSGIVLSLPLGIALALGRQSSMPLIKWVCVSFIEVIRGVPLIVWLFTASTLLNYFLPPGTTFDLLLRVIIMVTLFASAYLAEVVRGGLAALPKGQYEAADSLGLDYWKSMRLIILPQALKISIPGIVNTFIGLFKDTTLVVFIGLRDPLGLTNAIRATSEWNGIYWELYIFVGGLFFMFCFFMSRYSMYLERRLQTDHR
ncbi:amino acid ABC transporter permease [Yoonia vestfoldensis]|jgi:general L-amino acid transport system permease protein|uniref:Inner membrane amino-acid ABC transporter permease protein YhdY n=1 Tax=Yoonia vestfoldensis TaxID=245188 RepID=A0A1Y0EFZ1_9RHOB|nr:amino acid ABC transporter permease [Yoonia vestfoldensis]ARU02338.1 inner membrane amino-acid ABC transporter permease protein YhdY [Yoonia vestfoldensis]